MRRPDIPVLTTLRFPAAFAIVLYHFIAFTPYPAWIWQGLSAGVTFFYVLSGFILYYNYRDMTDRGFFWIARFARIWPVHLFCLALIFCVLPFGWLDGHANWPITLPLNILLLQAWIPFQGSVLSYNGVSWSLSVEVLFYISFPWMLGVMKARGTALPLVVSLVLSFVIVVGSTLLLPGLAGYICPFHPLARVFQFVLGMAAARWWLRERSVNPSVFAWTARESLAAAVCLVLIFGVPAGIHALNSASLISYWIGSELSAIAFATLIWVFAHQAGMISRLLSGRMAEWFGETSFALYMCHQIILRWLNPKIMTDPVQEILFFLSYFLASMVVAAAIFHLIETPVRRAIVSAYRRSRPAASPG